MDYLCELPNDASRRKALDTLPPTLNATYERILRRVNAINQHVQSLVARSLRWIVHHDRRILFTTDILCEAVSINLGDTRRNAEAVPDGDEILRWCSSLVRTAESGRCIELAHFTVEEFLLQIAENDGEFAAYRISPGHDDVELAKVCLTYLNLQDFNDQTQLSEKVTQQRFKDFPLREYAVHYWDRHARRHYGDAELYALVQRLLSPSKPNTLISWVHDWLPLVCGFLHYEDPAVMSIMNAAIAKASSLHHAAMLPLPEVSKWLIEAGCDVNRSGTFGTPLHCVLLGNIVYLAFYYDPIGSRIKLGYSDEQQSLVDIFLQAGADPNHYIRTPAGKLSPLFLGLSRYDKGVAMTLLAKGAMVDERCLALLENDLNNLGDPGKTPRRWNEEDLVAVIGHIKSENVEACRYSRFMDVVAQVDNRKGTDDRNETNDAEVTGHRE
ncbi:MAG: hypothetical protein Q9209_007075 [Squamulea sp. 1 TL-2023]